MEGAFFVMRQIRNLFNEFWLRCLLQYAKARPAMRDGLYIRLYQRIAAAAYLPQKDRK